MFGKTPRWSVWNGIKIWRYLNFAFEGIDGGEDEVMMLIWNFQFPVEVEEESGSGVENLEDETKRHLRRQKTMKKRRRRLSLWKSWGRGKGSDYRM